MKIGGALGTRAAHGSCALQEVPSKDSIEMKVTKAGSIILSKDGNLSNIMKCKKGQEGTYMYLIYYLRCPQI